MSQLLEARGLTKKFPGVTALREVAFDLRAGEIHGLCGENGAGKSTLIKLLAGIHRHGSYEGELRIDGEVVAFDSVRDAEAAGVAVITQEFALVDELSVAENIFLGRAPRRGWRVDWLEMQRRASVLLEDFGLAMAPETRVGELGIGQKQLVEIIRAMDKKSRILVLDEPTAALSEQEAGVLHAHLRRLQAGGTACIYISHKLEEVFALAGRITVLRDGVSIVTLATGETSIGEVIKHMVGRELSEVFPPRSATADAGGDGAPLLTVRDLWVAPDKNAPPLLRDISFALRRGEVLGLGGLVGAGRSELLMHLFGAWGRRVAGEVSLCGTRHATPTPRKSIASGLVLVTEDRKRYGLVLGQSIGFNLSLASLRKFRRGRWRIDLGAEEVANQGYCEALRIKAADQQVGVGGLSGGNQQKVVLGKALMTGPTVVMLDEPTRGIDVGAKREVYALIRQLTAEGKAVLLVSSELAELMGLSDRIIMLNAGGIGGEFSRAEFSEENLLAAAMGHGGGLTDTNK